LRARANGAKIPVLPSMENLGAWVVFNAFVLGMLALDLGVFHRKAHVVGLKEALSWSAVWIGLAFLYNAWIWHARGPEKGIEFLTGYLVEKSLSVDNVFVFALIFGTFRVPEEHQHRVLFWGILGALVMRAIMIAVGAALLREFHWLIYLFGAALVATGVKMALKHDEHMDVARHPAVRLFRRFVPATDGYRGGSFLVREGGRLLATPLALVLFVVEATDLVFAVDSIPAIFAITDDPFIVYTSNVFAILGLRALYFALAGVLGLFRFLKLGLAVILVFVGVKMLVVDFWKIPALASLGVVAAILAASIAASLLLPARKAPRA
jgi:tellurite resistance protein TerC